MCKQAVVLLMLPHSQTPLSLDKHINAVLLHCRCDGLREVLLAHCGLEDLDLQYCGITDAG